MLKSNVILPFVFCYMHSYHLVFVLIFYFFYFLFRSLAVGHRSHDLAVIVKVSRLSFVSLLARYLHISHMNYIHHYIRDIQFLVNAS